MNNKSIIKNYIYNVSYQLLSIILPIITTPYVSRVLGAENIGIYGYTISIVTYFILFGSLGVALYGQRQIAYERENKKKISITFWEIFLLRLITMSISTLIFYFTFGINGAYSKYFRILLLNMIATITDICWFFQGLEEFEKTVKRNIITKILSLVCVFAFVKTNQDLVIYFLIYVFSILFGNLTLWFSIPKFIEKVKLKDLYILRHLKPTCALFIPQIAVQVYTILDKTMIGAIIADKSEVGYYEQSDKVIRALLTIITSLGTVMLPRIANCFANNNKNQIIKYMKNSFNIVFLLAFPLMFGIISVSKPFVPVFFGEGYDKVSIIISILSPIILFIGLSNVTGSQFLFPTNRQKEYTISVICGAIVNLAMNFILIKRFGAIGASVGTIVAEFTVTSIQLYYTRRDFEVKKLIQLSRNYLTAGLIMFGFCWILRNTINKNIISIILQVIVGGVVYTTMLVLLKDKFFEKIINKIFKILSNQKRNDII